MLKVRRRRKRTASSNESDVPTCNQPADTEQFDYDAQILGVIDVMYSFQSKILVDVDFDAVIYNSIIIIMYFLSFLM